jgi:hypothetical protein
MVEIRSQAWVASFESAFMELDSKRRMERIRIAEAAIDTRLFDLRIGSHSGPDPSLDFLRKLFISYRLSYC